MKKLGAFVDCVDVMRDVLLDVDVDVDVGAVAVVVAGVVVVAAAVDGEDKKFGGVVDVDEMVGVGVGESVCMRPSSFSPES